MNRRRNEVFWYFICVCRIFFVPLHPNINISIVNRMKVLVATEKPFAKVAVDGIREVVEQAGYELALLEKYTNKQQLLEAVADIDALIIRSDNVDAEVLEAAKQLKIVVRAGAGYDNIDLAAATAHNVVAMNTPGQNSNAVAELALGLMVMAVRNMYNGTSGTELKGKKLGIHAYGNVGKNVARIAKGFGMEIYAYDAYCPNEVMLQDGVTPLATAEELYKLCDVVSLHIPATAETKGSINRALLANMPKGALLVNTARKEVIHEDELIQFMQERHDFRYVTDVMPAADQKMQELFEGRYFSTPKKMGAQTAEANINAGIAAAKQIVDFLQTGNTRFQVNK
jgi:D-3-phosphoglycerate dehydrogenase